MFIRDEFHDGMQRLEIIKGCVLSSIASGALAAPDREWQVRISDVKSRSIFIMKVLLNKISENMTEVNSSPECSAKILELAQKFLPDAWGVSLPEAVAMGILPFGYALEESWIRKGGNDLVSSVGVKFLHNKYLDTIIPVPAASFDDDHDKWSEHVHVIGELLLGQPIPCYGDVEIHGQKMKRLFRVAGAGFRKAPSLPWMTTEQEALAAKNFAFYVQPQSSQELIRDAEACSSFVDPSVFMDVRKSAIQARARLMEMSLQAKTVARDVLACDRFAEVIPAIEMLGKHFPIEREDVPFAIRALNIDVRALQGLMWMCEGGYPNKRKAHDLEPVNGDDRLTLLLAFLALVEMGVCPRYQVLNVGAVGINWPIIFALLAAYGNNAAGKENESPPAWYNFVSWNDAVSKADAHLDNVVLWFSQDKYPRKEEVGGVEYTITSEGPESLTMAQRLSVGRKRNLAQGKQSDSDFHR